MIPRNYNPDARTARALLAAAGATVLLLLAGCGGGGSSSPTTPTTKAAAPTAATRARVRTLNTQSFRGLSENGFQAASFASTRNGAFQTLGAPTAAGAASNAAAPEPLLGAFLRNVAAVPRNSRVAHLRAFRVTRDASMVPPPPPPPDPNGGKTGGDSGNIGDGGGPATLAPSFYYDYYLGLWTRITDTATTTTYALFTDEAATQDAGSIVTTRPADETTFPQVYHSAYTFKSGYLAGSHGSYDNTTNSDGSVSSVYNDTFADGSSDSGASNGTARGDYSYQSTATDTAGKTAKNRGTFRADGSGGTHSETADGYVSDYVFSADGSGHGTMTGPDPGLPVTVTWDANGNTTIRYADGSTETYSGWNSPGAGGTVEPDGGTANTAPLEPPAPPKP